MMPDACMLAPVIGGVLSMGCSAEPEGCTSHESPSVVIGRLLGDGEFSAIEELDDVPLVAAPQGGYGVLADLRTVGLRADLDASVDIHLAVTMDGISIGSFDLYGAWLGCSADLSGGTLPGVVFGLDPDRLSSPESLAALDGRVITLLVVLVDDAGSRADASTRVVVQSLRTARAGADDRCD